MASIDDLKGKSGVELDQLSREEQTRLDKLLGTSDPDFGLGGRPELLPVTDAEVKQAIDDLEKAIKMRNIVFIRAKQRETLEEIQRRKTSELAEANRILLHGLQKEVQPRERDSVRTASPSRSRRQMFVVNQPCAECGVNVHELPFEPDPGKKIYCPDCYRKTRGQSRKEDRTTVVGEVLNQRLQEDNERLRAQVETLTATAGHGGEKMPSGLSKKKQREWRSQHRGESEEE